VSGIPIGFTKGRGKRQLAVATMPAVPRVGDQVTLTGQNVLFVREVVWREPLGTSTTWVASVHLSEFPPRGAKR
jgi:hypothetical protein